MDAAALRSSHGTIRRRPFYRAERERQPVIVPGKRVLCCTGREAEAFPVLFVTLAYKINALGRAANA